MRRKCKPSDFGSHGVPKLEKSGYDGAGKPCVTPGDVVVAIARFEQVNGRSKTFVYRQPGELR
jgi:hypothetical protein